MYIKTKPLIPGHTIGIFTPSYPAHVYFKEKFEHALREMTRCGFNYKLGNITETFVNQGYRTASGRERAMEFMNLIEDPNVHALMSVIGGNNSSSMLEYLDFQKIALSKKPIIGYSDVTSLLLAIHTKSNMVTYYGPAVVPSFGEYPHILPYTFQSLLNSTGAIQKYPLTLEAPAQWSQHMRNALNDDWKTIDRIYQANTGWEVLNPGCTEGHLIVANLNTLSACLGTPYVPNFKGRILLLEQMLLEMPREERQLVQLKYAGVFDEVAGLIISKPEVIEMSKSKISIKELYSEILGNRNYPIIWNFDCGHTHPSLTLANGAKLRITADKSLKLEVLEGTVSL